MRIDIVNELNNSPINEDALKELLDYYDESPRKRKRRTELYQMLRQILVIDKKYKYSMSDISKELELERKTLYRYFNSTEDILVDLAYIYVVSGNIVYSNISNEIIAMKDINTIEKFKMIVREITDAILITQQVAQFIGYFEDIIFTMDKAMKPKIRYNSLITLYKKNNHYMANILYQMKAEGLIDIDNLEPYIETIEQSLVAFVSRIILKKEESDRYNLENIEIYSDLIIKGLCSQKTSKTKV